MRSLLLGSSNPGKLEELSELLASAGCDLKAPADFGLTLDIVESESDYELNARNKSLAYATASGLWSVADDSGLEVDALDGAPGPQSARLAGPDASDADRRRRLLELLRDKPRPWKARFRCLMALASPEAVLVVGSGLCEGEIVDGERGAGGFGYDPIFQLQGQGLTMAELDAASKNRLSHRGRAAAQILDFLKDNH